MISFLLFFIIIIIVITFYVCLLPVTLFKRLWESDSYYNSTSFRKIIILSCVLCCIPNREMAWNETKGVYNENEALQSILNIIFHFVWWLQSTLMMMGFNYFPWRPHVCITQLNNKKRRIDVEVFILDTLLTDRWSLCELQWEFDLVLAANHYHWHDTRHISIYKIFFNSFLNFKHFFLSFFSLQVSWK